ncbi:hypothetical protein AK830_g4243 [Neonectria ditissima]|uniref:Uncharacterized protein n=1 Tax=Neonectria ditissima TaxID=78410 RepID=A0A0N8H7N8_9HYPO|nr:hypothetical protein AK830_g4243 [Neonectria ditissima]
MTDPRHEETCKRLWISNALIRVTLKCTLVAFLLCCLAAPFLPRTEHGQTHSRAYTYYEPLALYDDAMAMAETYATAAYPLMKRYNAGFFHRLSNDAYSLCLALYPRGDIWTPDRGPISTTNSTALWQRILSDEPLADGGDARGLETFEQGHVDLYAFCDYVHGAISAAEDSYRSNDAHYLARPWPSTDEASLVWPADGDQVKAVEAIGRLLTSDGNFASGDYFKNRASILSLKTKLRTSERALAKLIHMADDVVVRFVAATPLPSARERLRHWASRDTSSDKAAAEIKRISQASLHLRDARDNVTSLIVELDGLTSLADSVLDCEAAWARLAGELVSLSTPAWPWQVTKANSSYTWTGCGWLTRRSRAERRGANAPRSIRACAGLKERLRGLSGGQRSYHDAAVEEDAIRQGYFH